MVKVEVIEKFTLKKFDELKNIKRGAGNPDIKGSLTAKDTFECTEEMASYLTGNNPFKKVVVKVIEVEPEAVGEIKYDVDEPVELKATIKPIKKKTSKK